MEMKLHKTYLSKKPSPRSFFIGVIALAFLTLFFGADKTIYSANGHLVFEKQEYWRAFTTTLLHADLTHLANNAFFFAGLAFLLHSYYGILVFPFLSVGIGGLINFVVLSTYPPEVHLVGVSGVIYFMASFWLTLYVLIERRQKLHHRFIHSIAVSLIFFFPHVLEARVSYLAHGLGFVFGIPFGLVYYALFRSRIRSRDEWIEVKRADDEEEVKEGPMSFHQETPEEAGPLLPGGDSARFRSPEGQ